MYIYGGRRSCVGVEEFSLGCRRRALSLHEGSLIDCLEWTNRFKHRNRTLHGRGNMHFFLKRSSIAALVVCIGLFLVLPTPALSEHAVFQSREFSRQKKGGGVIGQIKKDDLVNQIKDKALNKAQDIAKDKLPGPIAGVVVKGLEKLKTKKPPPPPPPPKPKPKPPAAREKKPSVAMREACVGCVYIWHATNNQLDQSAGFEAVKDAFERTCASMPSVFFDPCDTMFENEEQMINEYLDNREFEEMCSNIGMCSKDLKITGLPKIPK